MNKTIGTNVKVLRKSKAVDQKDLAKLLEVSQVTLSQKERGLVPFQVDELVKISQYFQVTLDELVYRQFKLETQVKVVVV